MDFPNLLDYQDDLKIKTLKHKKVIWDPIRKKNLILQPEEFVRQLFLVYLLKKAKFSPNKIRVEKGITLNQLKKRCDIIIYNDAYEPVIVVECKSYTIPLAQDVVDQICRYNAVLGVPYLVVTNGKKTAVLYQDPKTNEYEPIQHFPMPKDFV